MHDMGVANILPTTPLGAEVIFTPRGCCCSPIAIYAACSKTLQTQYIAKAQWNLLLLQSAHILQYESSTYAINFS